MACASNTAMAPPTTSAPSSPTSSMTTPTLLAHPSPIITTTTRGPTSEDAKHQGTKQRGGACSRTNSPARSRSPARSHYHTHTPPTTSFPSGVNSGHNSPSRGSLHGSPHSSRHSSPCEVRRRGGSLRGSLRNSPNNSPGGSRNGSPSSARHCGPALELPSGDGGSRKSPPSSPQCPLPEACNDIVQSLPAQQEEVMSSRQQTTPLRTPDFESGAVLDKLPFEYSSFLDASTSAFGKCVHVLLCCVVFLWATKGLVLLMASGIIRCKANISFLSLTPNRFARVG